MEKWWSVLIPIDECSEIFPVKGASAVHEDFLNGQDLVWLDHKVLNGREFTCKMKGNFNRCH